MMRGQDNIGRKGGHTFDCFISCKRHVVAVTKPSVLEGPSTTMSAGLLIGHFTFSRLRKFPQHKHQWMRG